MQLKTILNRVHPLKSFVDSQVRMIDAQDGPVIEVVIEPGANSRPVCSGCGQKRRGYDRQPKPRRFHFVPRWGMADCFVHAMRRVDCPRCGVTVEMIPWAEGKNHLTIAYQWFQVCVAKLIDAKSAIPEQDR
jgi:transposase